MLKRIRIALVITLCYTLLTMAKAKPNIVLLFSDDAGYADFGFHNSPKFRTPRLDEMAKNSVLFTNGYVCGSVCHPSRAGLLTGRNPTRFGHHYNPGGHNNARIPSSEITISELLKKAHYKTMCSGKWHLGDAQSHPQQKGFDEFYGILNGNCNYFNAKQLEHNGVPVTEHPYMTDAIAQKAIEFIERNKEHPFFVYASFTAVHTPDQAKPEHKALFNNISNGTRKTVAAMTWALDSACGDILDKLDELGLTENTLVFFMNDNGGANQYRKNKPYSGKKGTHLDGGVKVPFLLQWKGTLPANTKYHYPVSSLDFFATVCAAAEIPLPAETKYDGINLIPFITGQNSNRPQKYLYWDKWFRGMRYLDYKLILLHNNRAPLLYDLSVDTAETNNLAMKMPGFTTTLMKHMANWFDSNSIEPLFVEDSVWYGRTLEDYGNRGVGEQFTPKDTNIVLEKETVLDPVFITQEPKVTHDKIAIVNNQHGGILFQLPRVSLGTRCAIYSLSGRRLFAFTPNVEKGSYHWNGKGSDGSSLSTGMYIFTVMTPGKSLHSILFNKGL